MMELTDRQVEGFRQLLLDTQIELKELLDSSEEAAGIVTLDQGKVGRLSRMDAMQQQQMATANRVAYQRRLNRVQQALELIKQGEYGYCDGCGEMIHPQRLKIRPESLRCVDCKALSGCNKAPL